MLSRDDRIDIKGVTARAIDLVGSHERCSKVAGQLSGGEQRIRHQAFSSYTDQSDERTFVPFDVAVSMDEYIAGRHPGEAPPFLSWLCERLGFVPVRLPPAKRKFSPLGRLTGEAMRDVSRVFAELGTIIDENRVSELAEERLDRSIDMGVNHLLSLKEQVRADREAGGKVR